MCCVASYSQYDILYRPSTDSAHVFVREMTCIKTGFNFRPIFSEQCLSRLVARLSVRRPNFHDSSFHVRSVVYKMAMGKVLFPRVRWNFPVSIFNLINNAFFVCIYGCMYVYVCINVCMCVFVCVRVYVCLYALTDRSMGWTNNIVYFHYISNN